MFLAQFSFAQLTITPASGPNVCDGTSAISNTSGVIQSSITWYGNGAIIASNTYQIGNLCPGNYGVYYSQSTLMGGIDSVNATFIILGGGPNPCANFNVTLNTTPCSAGSNDGSILSNVTGGTPPYEISQKILKVLTSISEKIGEVNANYLSKQSPQLRKMNRIKTIHSSLKIEGNT